MAFTDTTLSAAVAAQDTYFALASVSGVAAPVSTTGAGYTYLLVEGEIMFVEAVNTTTLVVNVLRGQLGTAAVAHANATPVLIGLPSDFSSFRPATGAFAVGSNPNSGWGATTATASNVVVCPSYKFHITGTTVIKNITAPTGYVQGSPIYIVNDGSSTGLTWDATGNIAVAGTFTTAASMVEFIFDEASGKWHPSRLA